MKKVFFCLLLLSLFYNVYQYVNANKIFEGKEQELEIYKRRIEIIRDSVRTLNEDLIEANYFSLDENEQAQDLFYSNNSNQTIQNIKEELMALNHQPNGNPLIPYSPVDGQKFVINKIKMINHRWILADFYAGNIRGEVFIKYFVSENRPTEFKTVETVLYSL